MVKIPEDKPFSELPEALVEELLASCNNVSTKLSSHFKEILNLREKSRESLFDDKLLKSIDDLSSTPVFPTSCGVDGAYVTERLVATDISAVAALAVEGLTPPGPERRYWPKPRHFSHIDITAHNDATALLLRGIMMNLEMQLAYKAPHDVIFLDNSLTTPLIYYNQSIARIGSAPDNLASTFIEGKECLNEDEIKFPGIYEAFINYRNILENSRSDKIFAGVPKYTTKNEICQKLGCPTYEDRGLLNFILKKGEYVGPFKIQPPQSEWHIQSIREISDARGSVINALNNLFTVYYRPFDFFPVIRMEISPSVAKNRYQLFTLFKALEIQCVGPTIMEPYPLYLADRMVKHLGRALPAIRKTVTQDMATNWEDVLGGMFLAMHGYRTEFSKGGG